MKILIVSDAWYPQVNGVVRTLATVRDELIKLGHSVEIIGPDRFRTIPMPTYPEIRLAVGAGRKMAELIEEIDPGAIHIATEGPLGFAARAWCLKHGVPFTTAYHTRFPEYVRDRAPIPLALSYALVRRFHAPAFAVMVATKSIEEALKAKGFRNIRRWSRGVDTDLFRPRDKSFLTYPRPISMYVGRIAVEKNLEAFLKLDIPGTKVVVGDGPQMEEYQRRYPQAKFEGTAAWRGTGEILRRCRCLRLSIQNRYVRLGTAGSARVGGSGSRVSGTGSARCTGSAGWRRSGRLHR